MRFLRYLLPVLMITTAVAVIIFCYSSIRELDFSLLNHRSRVLYAADGSVAAYTLSSDTESYRFYTRVDDVSPLYLRMLLASEDRNFFSHPGVDPVSVVRAAVTNIRNGHVTSGASTIAMQVAKRLTGHERTYLNKLKEMIQAVYLTQKYGRRQILEWYLTLAPFGGNIEGVNAASLKWFNHLPKRLSPSEAALLTALPRAPEHIRPDRNVKSTVFYKNDVLRLSYEKNVISRDVWESSLKDDLPHQTFKIRQTAISCMNSYFEHISRAEQGTEKNAEETESGKNYRGTRSSGIHVSDDMITDEKKIRTVQSGSGGEGSVSDVPENYDMQTADLNPAGDPGGSADTSAAAEVNSASESSEDQKNNVSARQNRETEAPTPNKETFAEKKDSEPLSDRIMEIHSYLDPYIQNILLQQADQFHQLHNDGAVLSAVVLDGADHRVTGILGSSDLGVSQMCLPFAERSPGSALKPFVYGMAFEERKLHPSTTLHDSSRLFGTWNPMNFTRTFAGKIKAESALVRSLNLPAIEVLEMIGPSRFINFLNRFGQKVFVRNNQPDYSVILGSVNINLMDLAGLYGMLNEDGLLFSYSMSEEDSREAHNINGHVSDSALYSYIHTCDPVYEGRDCRMETEDRKNDHETVKAGKEKSCGNPDMSSAASVDPAVMTGADKKIISGIYRNYPFSTISKDADQVSNNVIRETSSACSDISSAGKFFYADTARTVFKILQKSSQPAGTDVSTAISYKTGTSSHYTDALSIGSLGNYTVAVAVRIPDNRELLYKYSGNKDASPHLFGIMSRLRIKTVLKPEIESELLSRHIPDLLREHIDEKKYIDRDQINIVFPENNTTVLPDFNGVIHIKYTGGKGTVYLVTDGTQTEGSSFTPDHSGYYEVTIMDLEGHSDTVSFRVTLTGDEQ